MTKCCENCWNYDECAMKAQCCEECDYFSEGDCTFGKEELNNWGTEDELYEEY